MEFIAARDFRIQPGNVWKQLKKSGRVVITSNGKPIAIMKSVEGLDLEEEWRAELIADAISALSRIRNKATISKTTTITDTDIDNEIKESRKVR